MLKDGPKIDRMIRNEVTEVYNEKTNEPHQVKARSFSEKKSRVLSCKLLAMVLRKRAPLNVVQTILKANPNAAKVPESSPSALQIALRHNAPVEVVKEIIQACPSALFAGNGTYDPLTYAKIWRSDEKKLIELLERPISHWLTPKRKHILRHNSSSHKKAISSTKVSRLDRDDQRELLNVKLITSTMIKSQKKYIAERARKQEKIQAAIEDLQDKAYLAKTESQEYAMAVTKRFDRQMSSLFKLVSKAVLSIVSSQDKLLEEMKAMEQRNKNEIATPQPLPGGKKDKEEKKTLSRIERLLSSYESLLGELKTNMLKSNQIENHQFGLKHHAVTHYIFDVSPYYYPSFEPNNDDTYPLMAENVPKKKNKCLSRYLFPILTAFRRQTKETGL